MRDLRQIVCVSGGCQQQKHKYPRPGTFRSGMVYFVRVLALEKSLRHAFYPNVFMLHRRGSRRVPRCSCHEKDVNRHKNLQRYLYSFVPSLNPRSRARSPAPCPSRRHRCRYLAIKPVIYKHAPYRPPLSYTLAATPKPRIPFQNKESVSDAAVGGDLVYGFKRGGEGVSTPARVDSRAQPGATLAV